MLRWKRSLRWLLPLIALVAAIATYPLWFAILGNFLVSADDPAPADMIVVLAGDSSGNRILKAAELIRRGFAPKALVSGPSTFYGLYESDLAIPFAERAGYPASYFIAAPNKSRSTVEEARVILEELRRRNVKRFIVVTSDYHTRRARKIYRRLAPQAAFLVVAAPDIDFKPDAWWHTRQGQKVFVLEWEKTVANCFGI